MKRLVYLLLALMLTSCEALRRADAEEREKRLFVNSVAVGRKWNLPANSAIYDLMEANANWSNYRIETAERYIYITVQNSQVISLWAKRKP
jgi:hypothetical protein